MVNENDGGFLEARRWRCGVKSRETANPQGLKRGEKTFERIRCKKENLDRNPLTRKSLDSRCRWSTGARSISCEKEKKRGRINTQSIKKIQKTLTGFVVKSLGQG